MKYKVVVNRIQTRQTSVIVDCDDGNAKQAKQLALNCAGDIDFTTAPVMDVDYKAVEAHAVFSSPDWKTKA